MRDLLNLIESMSMLNEKSRGLLYRSKGDRFFKGKKDSPEQELEFDNVTYYPGMPPKSPGEYESHEAMMQAFDELESQVDVLAVNKPTKASKAFAVLTLNDLTNKKPVYFARYFSSIKPDMTGAWKNSEIPGGFQLDKATSLKASYMLKPSDIFPPPARFSSVNELLDSFKQSEAAQPFVPGFEMLYYDPPQFPIFENASEYYTAIRDDLGEIIGPVAMIQGLDVGSGAKAAQRDLLDGGSYSGSSISFPSGKTNGLVDSYIVTDNGVEIGISSKGEKGATASVKNIADGIDFVKTKGSDEQKKLLKKYARQVKIIEDIGKESTLGFPIKHGLGKGFLSQEASDMLLQLIRFGAKSLDDIKMKKSIKNELQTLIDTKGAKTQLPNYNVGYHAMSALAKMVADDINADPEFGEACLKFLNSSPTIQLHMSATNQKDGDVKVTGFISKYPPNFRGTVELDPSKNYSATMAGGRMNFAYNGADAGVDDEQDAADQAVDVSTKAVSKAAKSIVNKKVLTKKKPEPKSIPTMSVGREKRKK